MKTTLIVLGVLSLIVGLFGAFSCVTTGLAYGREIGAPLNRAQVAAQPQEMDRYMEQVQRGMEKHRLTSGHWALLNQNVDNDFGVAYAAVKDIRSRLKTTMVLDPKSPEYANNTADIRGIISELDIGQKQKNQWNHWWMWAAGVMSIVMMIIAGNLRPHSRY